MVDFEEVLTVREESMDDREAKAESSPYVPCVVVFLGENSGYRSVSL